MITWWLLTVLVLWTIVFRYRRRRMYELASRIPGTRDELPVIGVARSLIGDTEEIMATLKRFSYESMEHNGIVKLWLNHILYFLIVNPVDLEMVLKTCMEKDDLHRFLRKVLGNGSIFAPVSIWRRRRKVTVPAFSPKNTENFVEVFSEQSEKLAKALKPLSDKGQFSIWPYINSYALDSVGETTMGTHINSQGDPNNPFLKAINRLLNLVCERIFHLWLQPDWMYKLFPQYYEHQKCVDVVHGFTDEGKHKKYRKSDSCNHLKIYTRDKYYDALYFKPAISSSSVIMVLATGPKYWELENKVLRGIPISHLSNYKRKDFLDLLISLSGGEQGYNAVELREEVLMITVAGIDTSAVSIGYTLQLLGKYPKIQDKVYKELLEIFGDSDRPLVKEDLLKLKYLERVIKESLRLFPPVPFIIRKVLVDTILPSGYTLPAGSGVVACIWGVHRDPKFWGSDAEVFDPDRFLPERFKLEHACSFMPFSNGPRNCLGYQYAMMSLKTSISAILRRYRVVCEEELTSVPRIRVKLDIMMKAVDGYQLALKKR